MIRVPSSMFLALLWHFTSTLVLTSHKINTYSQWFKEKKTTQITKSHDMSSSMFLALYGISPTLWYWRHIKSTLVSCFWVLRHILCAARVSVASCLRDQLNAKDADFMWPLAAEMPYTKRVMEHIFYSWISICDVARNCWNNIYSKLLTANDFCFVFIFFSLYICLVFVSAP